jgi:DNA-binding CsgD family transcriptional regulator/tetratricopeptide (TPR) repeat protein
MRPRLTSSHLVGRVAELAELELALHEASARHPVLVLLGGESGVGKTRLVAEFEEHAEALVLRGSAVEQADGELPYAPLLSALRPLVRERHEVLSQLSRGSRAQIARLLPGLSGEDGSSGDQPDASSQLRLFEALLELLDLLSESTTVVLILEDVHWADRSTRAFVAFLARSLRQERVMLVLTYRSDELHRRHSLLPLLTELERLDRARRIQLSPFDRAELAEALDDILGEAPSDGLVERLYTRSEGNPLYTEELLAAGLDGRGATPQSLRDAFLLRIERLSPDAQRAVRPIAVGRALDEATIVHITGDDHESVLEALREAVAQQVLCTGDEDNQLCFRHALLREAVYDDLLPGERAELHLSLARAYEDQACRVDGIDAERTATIAHHYAAAGDQPNALRATVQAALAARDIHAYGETADLAERALELWPRVTDPAKTAELDHVELLELAALGQNIGGDRARAEVLLQSALSELSPDADPRRRSKLLAQLARMQWTLNRQRESIETAERALALLPAGEATGERASLLAWFARTQTLRGHFRDAVRDGREALEAAIAAGDRVSETELLNTLGMALVGLGEVEDGLDHLRSAIRLARENDDIDSEAVAWGNLADMLGGAGRTLEALTVAKEGLEATAGRSGRKRHWLSVTVSVHAFNAGDWEAARAHLGPVPARQLGTLLIFRQLDQAQLALGEGDEELAAQSLDQIEPLVAVSAEPQYIGPFGALRAELRRRQRDLEAARAAVAKTLDRVELCTDDVEQVAYISAFGVTVEADIAQRARDLRERADERDAISRARIHMDRLAAAAEDGGPLERAWAATGAAELTRARGRDKPAAWLKAAAEWESVQRPYLAAIARWRASEAHSAAGDRAAAAGLAAEALETARRLGGRWLIAELTGLAERARLDLDQGVASPRPVVVDDDGPEDPFGLTARERQVLALIAEGATNRQIGAALYMAEKTASVHVSRILSKLGVHTRTEAAAVAHRQNLATRVEI